MTEQPSLLALPDASQGILTVLMGFSQGEQRGENALTLKSRRKGMQGSFDYVSDALRASDTSLRMTGG